MTSTLTTLRGIFIVHRILYRIDNRILTKIIFEYKKFDSCDCRPPLKCVRTQFFDIQNHCWIYRCRYPKFVNGSDESEDLSIYDSDVSSDESADDSDLEAMPVADYF